MPIRFGTLHIPSFGRLAFNFLVCVCVCDKMMRAKASTTQIKYTANGTKLKQANKNRYKHENDKFALIIFFVVVVDERQRKNDGNDNLGRRVMTKTSKKKKKKQ